MTTTTLPRPGGNSTGDLHWRTADQHLLNMPRGTRDDEQEQRELATRAILRIAGDHAPELLDILGLVTTDTPAIKRCNGCGQYKPHADFRRHPGGADGLSGRCKPCDNTARRDRYARVGPKGISGGDGNVTWEVGQPGGRGTPCSKKAVAARLEQWQMLRITDELAPRQAAEKMRISMRSARRYDQILKDRGLLKDQEQAVA